MGQKAERKKKEKEKTEKALEVGRRTREEIAKWNQMIALRFQTEGRHQTSPASLRGRHRERGGEGAREERLKDS